MSNTIRLEESSGRIVPKARPAPPKRSSDIYKPLAEAMQRLGLNERAADVAARGRDRTARRREAVRNVAGLSSRCFAWVPDQNNPETWQFQICRSEDPSEAWLPDPDLVKLAVSQLPDPGSFSMANALNIPDADLPKVLATLKSAWIGAGLPIDEMPDALKNLELANALRSGTGSMHEALTAARGRTTRRRL